MKIKLSEAYFALKIIEKLSVQKCFKKNALEDEIKLSNKQLCEDIENFNQSVDHLLKAARNEDFDGIIKNTLFLNTFISNIETTMSNIGDDISTLIQKSEIFDEKNVIEED